MRGPEQLKKTLKLNGEIESALLKAVLLLSAASLGLFIYMGSSIPVYLSMLAASLSVLFAIRRVTSPRVSSEGGHETLLSVVSIGAPGPVAFLLDALFWLLAAQVGMAFSSKWALLLLGIPFSFFTEFMYKPYRKLKAAGKD